MVDWLTSGLIRPNLLSGSTSPGAAFHLHQRNEVDPGQCLLDGTRGTRGRRETAGWQLGGRYHLCLEDVREKVLNFGNWMGLSRFIGQNSDTPI